MCLSEPIIEFQRSLVILIDNIIKEDRNFLETIVDLLRCHTEYILAMRNKQKKELFRELDESLQIIGLNNFVHIILLVPAHL